MGRLLPECRSAEDVEYIALGSAERMVIHSAVAQGRPSSSAPTSNSLAHRFVCQKSMGGSDAKQNLVSQMSWAESNFLSCLCWHRQKITPRRDTRRL